MTFGERVKQARLANGLTQGEVAIVAGFRDRLLHCLMILHKSFRSKKS